MAADESHRVLKDEDLVYGLKTRDGQICELFYNEYSPVIYRVAIGILSNPDAALDCTQDVLLKIIKSIHSFKGHSSLKTWVITITINTARSSLKRWITGRSKHVYLEAELLCSGEEGPESIAIRKERQSVLMKALSTLSAASREILILRESEHLSYEELSEILGIPLGTVRSRLARARLDLAKRYFRENRLALSSIPR